MKKSLRDLQQDILLTLIKPLVYIWMWLDAKCKIHIGKGVDFKRKEPFIMLANHTFMFDVIHVPLRFKKSPFIIGSQTLFTEHPIKFFVTHVAHVISKAKGRSDLITIKHIYEVVEKGYPILIFPEGDTTFYGETGYIEESTMKLIKKLELDVITCNVKGGYLSKPRWATGKGRNHRIELFYNLTIKKDELKRLNTSEISTIINKALYNNDYLYQKNKMIPHPGKKLAEGLENIIYVCPFCESINSIETEKNNIKCNVCGHEGHIDKFGFIHDFKFDNLISWNEYQLKFSDKLKKSKIETKGFLYLIKMKNRAKIPVGKVSVKYNNNVISISGAYILEIPITEIKNPTVTLRSDFGFIYNDVHYLINLDKFNAAFLRIVQDKY